MLCHRSLCNIKVDYISITVIYKRRYSPYYINFDRRLSEIKGQKYTTGLLHEAFNTLVGETVIKRIGQVVNKDKDALANSKYNLQLIKYKLEKHGVIKTIGEINGSPLTIELSKRNKL